MTTLLIPPPVPRFKFTVDDYFRLAEVGILGPADRVELIDGEVIRMSPIGRIHAGIVTFLADHFAVLRGRAVVWVQNPVRLDEHNDPQPDVVLLKPRKDKYKGKTASFEDVLLAIEVSDSSFDFDYNVKRPIYAKHLIPELLIVDANEKCVHVCRKPKGARYEDERILRGKDVLAPLAFPRHRITVKEVVE